MAKPYISELINTTEVFDAAFAQPGMRIKPRSKKVPSVEQATKAVLVEVERAVGAYIAGEVTPKLEEALESHVAIYGDVPVLSRDSTEEEKDEADQWESALDEAVEEAIAQYVPDLSAGWLGEHTIGSGIHLEDGIVKFCASLGKEYFKQLTYGKTPAQVMSNAGVTTEQIQARLTAHSNPTPEEKAMAAQEADHELQTVYQKIAEHIGKDHDTMTVYGDIELALDDDDGLAYGAGARLGVDEADVETLRMVAIEHGSDAVDVIQHAVQAVLDGTKKKPAKKAKAKAPAPEPEEDEDDTSFLEEAPAAKPAKAPKAAAPKKAKAEAATAIEASVLLALKELGAGDTETAKSLGVSRQTYTNYLNGKTEFSPTSEQYDHLRGLLVDKANAALEALAAIDGTEADTVF